MHNRSHSLDPGSMEECIAMRVKDASQPTEEEGAYFFSKLPSRARLVARTGEQWPDSNFGPLCKFLCPFPLGHPFVATWNTPGNTLQIDIREQLAAAGIDWVAIDCVGKYLDPPLSDGSSPTLLITVPPTSTDWNAGVRAVNACKIVLEDHDIKDMEVEMKEGMVSQMVPDNNTCIDDCEGNELLLGAKTNLLGLSIGAKGRKAQGTLGLHLTLTDEDGNQKQLGLSCRHVFFDMDDTHEHRHGQGQEVVAVSFSEAQIKEAVEKATEKTQDAQNEVNSYEERIDQKFTSLEVPVPAKTQELLHHLQKRFEDSQRELAKISQLLRDGEKLCEFGHILYSPPIADTLTPSLNTKSWLPDWALIEIVGRRAEEGTNNNLCYISSGLMIDKKAQELMGETGINMPTGYLNYVMGQPGSQYIPLKSAIIPESEMHGLPSLDRAHDYDPSHKQLVVFKYGRTTKLTAGLSNKPVSLTRKSGHVSEEWCILPLAGRVFSRSSDSGSLVWDTERRLGGIITSGDHNDTGTDVTYATPMERLLQDIRARGYNVEVPEL
ncbi:hypothetical protein N3K66_006489 [Trichothecium roseum]|uniref:Uncharacterized protein n=1 Tax=Trichothecium roseum TaxID=47278 RepID=A0ACC0UVK2_9HYPO|nr:hypothetical protein N3K66_006489 [Trichothecium roseum]